MSKKIEIENIIYGLRDPRNDVYQYIGKSTVGKNRPLQHLCKSHSDYVNKWVEELASKWLYPVIDVIEYVDSIDDLMDREKYWIEYYSSINPLLFNIQYVTKEEQPILTQEEDDQFHYFAGIVDNIHVLLKKERLRRGLTQGILADKMHVNRCTVNMLELGGSVNLRIIKKYINIIRITPITNRIYKERVGRTAKEITNK